MSHQHQVAIVLDRCFGGDLWTLSREVHVWIVRSDHNEGVARAVWNRETEEFPVKQRVTVFDGAREPGSALFSILGTVDLHHNEYSAPEPWDSILVVGLTSGAVDLNLVARELGGISLSVSPEDEGFRIKRTVQPAAPSAGAMRRR
ncbi:MAG: hypothetical protein H8E31_13975 [Planctomycetes bacterium]|nr:hypothetical protein [Planctomycetota bacterium]